MRATVYFTACCRPPKRRGGIRSRHIEGPSRPCGVAMLDHMSEVIENRYTTVRRVTKGWVTRGKAQALHGTYEGDRLCDKASEDPDTVSINEDFPSDRKMEYMDIYSNVKD